MTAAMRACPYCRMGLGVDHPSHTEESAAKFVDELHAEHLRISYPCNALAAKDATIADLRDQLLEVKATFDLSVEERLAAVTKERDEQSALCGSPNDLSQPHEAGCELAAELKEGT